MSDTTSPSPWNIKKLLVMLAVVGVGGTLYALYGDRLSWESLAEQETQLRQYQQAHPILVYGVAWLVYVVVTGLSLPGATPLTRT